MKRLGRNTVLILIISISFSSCEKIFMGPDPEDTPINNFDIFWNTIDTKYALFPCKGVDWDSIRNIYRPLITDHMPDTTLFRILGDMIMELRDAHTNIYSPYGRRSYPYTAGYPSNFSETVMFANYLGWNTRKKDGILYRIIDSVGYIYIPSFSPELSDGSFRQIMDHFKDVKGIILDVRQNAGGNESNAKLIANHFFDRKRKVETKMFKTGPGHSDLAAVDYFIDPKRSLKFNKPTVVLTNRKSYSACNSFVSWMSLLPKVLVAGDTTGGGAGTPFYGELPNGWTYRYSSNAAFRPDGLNIELGVPPDTVVYLRSWDLDRNVDTMIEFALDHIRSAAE